jgi:hypothetical protein
MVITKSMSNYGSENASTKEPFLELRINVKSIMFIKNLLSQEMDMLHW